MPVTIDQALELAAALAQQEYEFTQALYRDPDRRAVEDRRFALGRFAAHRAEIPTVRRPRRADEAWFAAHRAGADAARPREVLAARRLKKKDHGEVVVLYVTSPDDGPDYMRHVWIVGEVEGEPRLVSVWFGRDFGQTWEPYTGLKVSPEGEALEVRLLRAPRDERGLPAYQALGAG